MNQTNKNLEIVKDLVASLTKVDKKEIPEDKPLNEIGKWDSLCHVQMVCGMEKIIGKNLKLMEIIAASTVEDWVQLLEKYSSGEK